MTDTATARADLALLAAADIDPVLAADELDRLINLARRPDDAGLLPDAYEPWRSVTPYLLNDYVVPGSRNGHVYKVTVAGTSGAAAPTWPTDSEDTVTDGTVTWQEAGAAAWTPTWDLNAAVSQAWRLKAAKLSSRIDFSADGASFKHSQALSACLDMARIYQRRSLGQIDLPVPRPPQRRHGGELVDDRLDPEEFPLRDAWARGIGLLPEQLP